MADSFAWPVIGVDESGKGDFFGPLVISAVLVEKDQLARLADLQVRDSKRITDNRILQLADTIRREFVVATVVIGPEKYNQLYEKMKNLNRLLGWGHARAIENVLQQKDARTAISDKFGSEHFISRSLQEKGKAIHLVQMVRGEGQPPVAAASIVARAEFVRRVKRLSDAAGMALPKGASAAVDRAGVALVEKFGDEALARYSKLHFKNYKRIVLPHTK
jgi:ribonuclease HIII